MRLETLERRDLLAGDIGIADLVYYPLSGDVEIRTEQPTAFRSMELSLNGQVFANPPSDARPFDNWLPKNDSTGLFWLNDHSKILPSFSLGPLLEAGTPSAVELDALFGVAEYSDGETSQAFEIFVECGHGESIQVVPTEHDTGDAEPSDACALDVDGQPSLRAAIEYSNQQPGRQEITLAAGVYELSRGVLDIDDDVVIRGEGRDVTIVTAGEESGIISVDADGSIKVTLESFTLRGGRPKGSGGAINSDSDLTLNDMRLMDNHAGSTGGAVRVSGGDVTVIDSVFENNHLGRLTQVSRDGALSVSSGGKLTVSGSSFIGNDGGIEAHRVSGTIVNSTFSGNEQYYAIENLDGNLLVLNNTIAQNTGGGVRHVDAGTVSGIRIGNSIVAGNERDGEAEDVHPSSVITSIGGNLFGVLPDLLDVVFGAIRDVVGDPMLSELGLFGGTTPTQRPSAGSPSIDGGDDNLLAVIEGGITTDQRGLPRVTDGDEQFGARVDIGAVEINGSELIPGPAEIEIDYHGISPSEDGTINLPKAAKGDDVELRMTITNSGESPMNVWLERIEGDDFESDAEGKVATLEPGETYEIVVRVRSEALGTKETMIRIHHDKAENMATPIEHRLVARITQRFFIGFDGYRIEPEKLREWGADWSRSPALLDSTEDGITVAKFYDGHPERIRLLSLVMFHVERELMPFELKAEQLLEGEMVMEQQGVATIFVGRSDVEGGPHVAGDIDHENNNANVDVGFVGQEDWLSTEGTALRTAQLVLHEALHLFGAEHLQMELIETPDNELDIVPLMAVGDERSRRRLVHATILDHEIALRDDPTMSQNTFGYMARIFGTGGSGDEGPRPFIGILPEAECWEPDFYSLGDINGDGKVDFDDFLELSRRFGELVSRLTAGDLDGDGLVDFGDYLRLSANFGREFYSTVD